MLTRDQPRTNHGPYEVVENVKSVGVEAFVRAQTTEIRTSLNRVASVAGVQCFAVVCEVLDIKAGVVISGHRRRFGGRWLTDSLSVN